MQRRAAVANSSCQVNGRVAGEVLLLMMLTAGGWDRRREGGCAEEGEFGEGWG
jgi:hypothetical protein